MGNLTTFFDELSNAAVGMGQSLGNAFMAAASGAEDSKEQLKNALGGILDATFAAATAHKIPRSPLAPPSFLSRGPLRCDLGRLRAAMRDARGKDSGSGSP